MSRGPLSPLATNGDHDTFVSRQGPSPRGPSGPSTPLDAHLNNPYDFPLVPRPSPPSSQHPSSGTDMSRPSVAGSFTRPASSASSVARSSEGRGGFGAPMKIPPNRDSGRSYLHPEGEEILQSHYNVLRTYLASSLHDAQGNVRPNRARDKLLRLSSTQFMELSTDVYDELIRREDDRTQRVLHVPPFLPPRSNFHPKRNQARQKLSTLPVDRFKQLATDVYYELERRIPRFMGDHSRSVSMSSNASRSVRGPPSSAGGYRAPPPYGGSANGDESMSRPIQKTPQSNTIVPNKGTMIEDDDDDDDEDAFGLEKVMTGLSARGGVTSNAEDRERIEAQEMEIATLKGQLEASKADASAHDTLREHVQQLEARLKTQEDELTRLRPREKELHQKLQDQQQDMQRKHQEEQNSMQSRHQNEQKESEQKHIHLQTELDKSLSHAQQLQADLEREIANLQNARTRDVDELQQLKAQLSAHEGAHSSNDEEARFEVSRLQEQLAHQEEVTNQVRDETMMYLREMRELSHQNDVGIEREEKLHAEVMRLEQEMQEWRRRYANMKAQNKSLRASTIGLSLPNGFASGSLLQQEGILSDRGLVRDVDVTHFQLAVDELLNVARQSDTGRMLQSVRNVIISVQSIASAALPGGQASSSTSPSTPAANGVESVDRLHARVTGFANSLITATKQHAAASGLSPVVLLDAAASNLAASIVALVKAVGIRESAESELAHANGHDDDYRRVDALPGDRDKAGPVGQVIHATSGPGTSREVDAKNLPTSLDPGLARSNTATKKAGGWFGGWGRKTEDEDSASSAYSRDASPHPGHRDSDYESYR